MGNKKISIGLFVFICLVSHSFAVELKTQVQKESYSIGASTGSYISNQLFEQSEFGAKVDVEAVIDGFVDALKKKQKLIRYLLSKSFLYRQLNLQLNYYHLL